MAPKSNSARIWCANLLGNSAEKCIGLILWILREMFNRRKVLKLKICNNENVKFDTAGKVISARQERPETTIHELPELELCK